MTPTSLEDACAEVAATLRYCDIDSYARDHLVKAHAILQEQCREAQRAAWRSEPTTPRVYDATNERWVG